MPRGILGTLPPGLQGYVAAEQMAQQRGANQLNQATGIFGLQNAMQMQPLQRALLEQQVAQMQANAKLRAGILSGGGGGAPVTPQEALAQGATMGDIGPTVNNAARIGQVPQGGAGGRGMDQRLQAMLLSGDPGMTALAKAELERAKGIPTREGGGIYSEDRGWILRPQPKTEAGVQIEPSGAASPVPRYAETVAGIEGAKTEAQERARAGYDLVTVPGVGDQPPTYASRAQLLPGARGQAVPKAPGAARPGSAVPPAPRPVAGPSPAQKAAADAQAAYSSRVATQGAEGDVVQHDTALAAKESVAKMDELLKHLKSSQAITGMGADVLKNVERMKVLVSNSERSGRRVSDTELLDAMMGQDVFPMIKALGIGARGLDTPAEREFLRQVMSGTISMNKQTLIKMTEMRKDIAERAINRWDRRVDAGELDRYFMATGRTKERLGQGRRSSDTETLFREADSIINRTLQTQPRR